MKLSIVCICSLLSLAVAADETSAGETQVQGRVKQPYSRYESIVDRQMFGPLPPGFDPEKMPNEVSKSEQKELTAEQEKLQSSIHFSMINVTPDGNTVVGFTDNSDPKVPVPMYLKVGESRNGWKVLEADPATATMRIAKGDIEVSLTIGGNSASDGTATSKTTAPAAAGSGRILRGGGLLGSNSLRARRARRDAERRQAAEDEARRQAEEKAAREDEKAQREAEREEQRRALESLRDELKKQREENAKALEEAKAANESAREESDENNAAE